jgi:hypothetical protein
MYGTIPGHMSTGESGALPVTKGIYQGTQYCTYVFGELDFTVLFGIQRKTNNTLVSHKNRGPIMERGRRRVPLGQITMSL